ncbi:hypothetical protein V1511DRAFT_452581, partial [Dipodascopsis uninucleata]
SLIRDFAYPSFHPLHFGPPPMARTVHRSLPSSPKAPLDGPPFPEDPVSPSYDGDIPDESYIHSIQSHDEIHGRAIALFDFTPENDNEVALREGQQIWISYRHGQGWLVAEDPQTGESGLVPEEYVEIVQSGIFP